MKRVNVELDLDLHKKAKSLAALEGSTLKDFIKTAVESKVDKNWMSKN